LSIHSTGVVRLPFAQLEKPAVSVAAGSIAPEQEIKTNESVTVDVLPLKEMLVVAAT
jgi:hypothetical protein